jgi:hypothetical protein
MMRTPDQQQQAESTPLLAERPSDFPHQKRGKTIMLSLIWRVLLTTLVIVFILFAIFFVVVLFKAPKSSRPIPSQGPSDGNLGIGFHLTTGYTYVDIHCPKQAKFMYQ